MELKPFSAQPTSLKGIAYKLIKLVRLWPFGLKVGRGDAPAPPLRGDLFQVATLSRSPHIRDMITHNMIINYNDKGISYHKGLAGNAEHLTKIQLPCGQGFSTAIINTLFLTAWHCSRIFDHGMNSFFLCERSSHHDKKLYSQADQKRLLDKH